MPWSGCSAYDLSTGDGYFTLVITGNVQFEGAQYQGKQIGFCLHRVKHLGVKKLVVLTNLLKFSQC